MNERSTNLIYEKTQEIFSQRLELLRESIVSYWESDKNQLLSNAMLYAESEKIVNYSIYGLLNLLQREMDSLISKTGYYGMEVKLRSGQTVSSRKKQIQAGDALDLNKTDLNLALVEIQQTTEGVFLSAEVPVNKLGELVGRLSLRRKLDDTRLKKMARNLQAEITIATREGVMASSLPASMRRDLVREHYKSFDRKEDIFKVQLDGKTFSIGRTVWGKTVDGSPLIAYVAVSQEKMLSMVEQARTQNMTLTAWVLVISLLFSFVFSDRVLIAKIRQIRDGANVIAEGELTHQLPIVSGDELGELARSFNRMAQKLKKNRDKTQHYIDRVEKLANYIQDILRSLRTCVITWTIDGKVETANAASETELGEIFPNLKGLSIRSFLKKVNKNSRADFIDALRKLDESNRQFDLEFDWPEHGGARVFQGSFSYLKDNEKPYGFILSLNNITQRKIIEQQLYHADKLSSIGQLAASVAHEIKNPLASIKTLGQLLQEEITEDEDCREYVDVIVSEVNRLNGVVEQLLKYAKPEGSSLKNVPFAEVITPVLSLVKHESERHQVVLTAEYSPELNVYVDSEKIKQVFLNLVFNGIQAMKNGGSLTIRAFQEFDSQWTAFEIEDTGAGMPKEVVDRIFEPFFTTKQRGTGLGLAIVKKIIDLHGGKIEVSSITGEGTKILIYLPQK